MTYWEPWVASLGAVIGDPGWGISAMSPSALHCPLPARTARGGRVRASARRSPSSPRGERHPLIAPPARVCVCRPAQPNTAPPSPLDRTPISPGACSRLRLSTSRLGLAIYPGRIAYTACSALKHACARTPVPTPPAGAASTFISPFPQHTHPHPSALRRHHLSAQRPLQIPAHSHPAFPPSTLSQHGVR